MAEKTYSLDFKLLKTQLEKQQNEDLLTRSDTTDSTLKTSIFSFGSSVFPNRRSSSPEITFLEIMKDGLNNPYIQINWRIKKEDVDSGRITAFNIFRIKVTGQTAEFDKSLGTTKFDRNAFDRLSIKNLKTGKFSEEKKAINNVKTGMIDLSTLNHNLYLEQLKTKNLSQRNVNELKNNSLQVYNETFDKGDNIYEFHKIGTVSYSQFLAEQKKKFVYVSHRDFSELLFRDRNVGFGETFGYYIEAKTQELSKPLKSNAVYVSIDDFAPAPSPAEVTLKQVQPTQIQIRIMLDDYPYAAKILVQKRSDREMRYEFIPDIPITGKSIIFTDNDIKAGTTYYYRFYLENIFGKISEPVQIATNDKNQGRKDSLVQKPTPELRTTVLKKPIFTTSQDDNSNFIKINIFPNDPLILNYSLDRRDLTIKEKAFRVPSKLYTNYGADGWETNQFFVEKNIEIVESHANSLLAKNTLKEIIFIDNTVQKDHIYQYRLRGYDLAGNGSNYCFSYIKSKKKKDLRFPINFRIEIVRSNPLRVKILWDDDNAVLDDKSKENVFFKVERRKIDEEIYEAFPLTKNNFIIDEVATLDAIDFDEKALTKLGKEISGPVEVLEASKIRRSFGLPGFLQDNIRYFYKVSAISSDVFLGESNPSPEFEFWALVEVPAPVDFIAEAVNSQVKPMTVRLFWRSEIEKPLPDNWQIERKEDSQNEIFKLIGRTYLENEYIDYNVTPGRTYVYRVKAFDILNRPSNSVETKIII